MKNQNRSAMHAQSHIKDLIDRLLTLFMKCKNRENSLHTAEEKLQTIELNNKDFVDVGHEYRENNNMLWCLIILLLSVCIDYFLVNNGVTIICEITGLPHMLTYFVPPILVLLECGLSYFTSIDNRYHARNNSWISKKVPYLVLIINVALTILAVAFVYSGKSGIAGFFHALTYGTVVVIAQLILLAASMLLHIWIIKNSDLIADMLAYYRFRLARHELLKTKAAFEKALRTKLIPRFSKGARNLIETIEWYKKDFPNERHDFVSIIPQDLIAAMNKIMGRNVFGSNNANNKSIDDGH